MTTHVKRVELQGIDDLRTLITTFDECEDPRGKVLRVRISKLGPLATYKSVGTVPADEAEEQHVALRWGGGKYKAACLSNRGLILCGLIFEVAEPDEQTLAEFPEIIREVSPGGTAAATAAPAGVTPELVAALESQILMLKNELDRLTRLFERALERGTGEVQAATSLEETVGALASLDKLRGPDKHNSADEIFFRAAEFVDKLRGTANGEAVAGDGNPWLSFARDVWRDAGPEIKELATMAVAAAPSPPGPPSAPLSEVPNPQPGEEGQPVEQDGVVDTRATFDFIHQMLEAGEAPELISKMMIMQVRQDPALAQIAADIVGTHFDAVSKLDPEDRFQSDPKRSQLREIWTSLKDAELFTANDPSGAERHA